MFWCLDFQIFQLQKQPPEVFCEKGVLKNLINSQENICTRVSFFNKAGGLRPEKFLRTPFSQNTFGRVLLQLQIKENI